MRRSFILLALCGATLLAACSGGNNGSGSTGGTTTGSTGTSSGATTGTSSGSTTGSNTTGSSACTVTLTGAVSATVNCVAQVESAKSTNPVTTRLTLLDPTNDFNASVLISGPPQQTTYDATNTTAITVTYRQSPSSGLGWMAGISPDAGSASVDVTSLSTLNDSTQATVYSAHGTFQATLVPNLPDAGNITASGSF